jgi:uncharacterized protein YciI
MVADPAHPIIEGARNKALGSLLIVQAESIEEVRKVIEGDVFSQSGVVSGKNARLI